MSFKEDKIAFRFELVQWIMNIAQFLQNSCEAKRTGILTRHLEEIYLKDALTGLYNRHGFTAYFKEKNIPSKYKTMLLFDLDKLKEINDTYGHEEGDFALRTISQAILRAKGDGDLCARFGGDEFYCYLSHDDKDYGEEYIKKVTKFLNNYNALSKKPYSISASAGYETVETSSGADLDALFKCADEKMYAIKKARK